MTIALGDCALKPRLPRWFYQSQGEVSRMQCLGTQLDSSLARRCDEHVGCVAVIEALCVRCGLTINAFMSLLGSQNFETSRLIAGGRSLEMSRNKRGANMVLWYGE